VDNWQFTTVKLPKDKILPLNLKNLKKHVDCNIKNKNNQDVESVKRFFKQSNLQEISYNQGVISLRENFFTQNLEIKSIGNIAPQGAIDLTESGSSQCLALEKALSGPYSVHKMGNLFVIENWNLQKFLVAKPV
jgi:hypothetical protein